MQHSKKAILWSILCNIFDLEMLPHEASSRFFHWNFQASAFSSWFLRGLPMPQANTLPNCVSRLNLSDCGLHATSLDLLQKAGGEGWGDFKSCSHDLKWVVGT